MTQSFLQNLNWRFATKKFDNTKPLSDEDLKQILWAIKLAPTSYGLQPFHVYVVTNPEIREKIRTTAWGQPQITDASVLLVFTALTDVFNRIDQSVNLAIEKAKYPADKAKNYGDMMRESLSHLTPELAQAWSAKQAYIALGFAMAACAELEIDSCPMEGFNALEVDKILNLPDNKKTIALLPLGYRASEPDSAKLRFPDSDLFTKV